MDVAGKKAVIVGGASGMAKATAELLRERGASVAILDLPGSAGANGHDPGRVRGRPHQGRGIPEADGTTAGVRQVLTAIIDNPMINGGCVRLDAGQRFAPK